MELTFTNSLETAFVAIFVCSILMVVKQNHRNIFDILENLQGASIFFLGCSFSTFVAVPYCLGSDITYTDITILKIFAPFIFVASAVVFWNGISYAYQVATSEYLLTLALVTIFAILLALALQLISLSATIDRLSLRNNLDDNHANSNIPIALRDLEVYAGEGFIQIGQWRIGPHEYEDDRRSKHFLFSSQQGGRTKCSVIYRSDGTAHGNVWETGGDIWNRNWLVTDSTTQDWSGVTFGDGYIDFGGIWRLGLCDQYHLSLAHIDGYTSIIWRSDGLVMKGPFPDKAKCSAWESHISAEIGFGWRVLEIGQFRFSTGNNDYLQITHTGTNAIFFNIKLLENAVESPARTHDIFWDDKKDRIVHPLRHITLP